MSAFGVTKAHNKYLPAPKFSPCELEAFAALREAERAHFAAKIAKDRARLKSPLANLKALGQLQKATAVRVQIVADVLEALRPCA